MTRFKSNDERLAAEKSAFEDFRAAYDHHFQSGAIYIDGDQIVGRDPTNPDSEEVCLGWTWDFDGLQTLPVYLAACPNPTDWL